MINIVVMKSENKKISGFKSSSTKTILDIALKTFFGISYNDITLAYNQYGKPYIKDYDSIHFNISHSGKWIVCAINNFPIGIDIQKIRSSKKNTFEQIFYETEVLTIKRSVNLDINEVYCLLWTIKESYLKKIGKGLIDGIDKFKVGGIIPEIYLLDNTENQINDCFLYSFQLDELHFMTLCTSYSINSVDDINFYLVDD